MEQNTTTTAPPTPSEDIMKELEYIAYHVVEECESDHLQINESLDKLNRKLNEMQLSIQQLEYDMNVVSVRTSRTARGLEELSEMRGDPKAYSGAESAPQHDVSADVRFLAKQSIETNGNLRNLREEARSVNAQMKRMRSTCLLIGVSTWAMAGALVALLLQILH